MHIALAPFGLKAGVTEQTLLSASDRFDQEFASKQDGIIWRVLVKDGEGGYADLVFFRDLKSIEWVIEAEQNSDVCATFLADDPDYRQRTTCRGRLPARPGWEAPRVRTRRPFSDRRGHRAHLRFRRWTDLIATFGLPAVHHDTRGLRGLPTTAS
jgi:hypothetical protein